MRNLVVDLGNTAAKMAIYNELHRESDVTVVSHDEMTDKITQLCDNHGVKVVVVASVSDFQFPSEELKWRGISTYMAQSPIKLPFSCRYATCNTLGIDRVAAVVAALEQFSDPNMLIIDVGTAATYEMIVDREYIGGTISPGMAMRFKALNAFTGKLPLGNAEHFDSWIGYSTDTALAAGVVNGLQFEIEGYISNFFSAFGEKSKVIITGGDHKYLAQRMKNSIFALPNLVLDGIDVLYEKFFDNYNWLIDAMLQGNIIIQNTD